MKITPEDALWITGALSLPTLYTILTTLCDWCAALIITIRKATKRHAPHGASPERAV